MGIPQFYKKIKKDYPSSIVERYDYDIYKTYDFIIFDFLSLIYSVYNLFSLDINYYIRILFYLRYAYYSTSIDLYEKSVSFYSPVLKKIICKYGNYYNNIYLVDTIHILKLIDNMTIDNLNYLLQPVFNNEDIIIDNLIILVLIHVKKIVKYHISASDKYLRTYIFFDGVPSKAKIKEQMIRRIYPDIIKNIKKNLFSHGLYSEVELEKKLLNDSPPSIGINKPIVIKIHSVLSRLSHSTKGKFNINMLSNYGEAEHQIMSYLSSNLEYFSNKRILLVSPDADLILLSIIMRSNNIFIDIFKIDIENNIEKQGNNQLIANFIYAYIYPYNIITNLNLINAQEELDVSFILLLLGDDFLPIVPNMNINSLKIIIDIYHKSNLQIVNLNSRTLNYINFIVLLGKLKDIYNHTNIDKGKLKRERENLYVAKKKLLYNLYSRNYKSKYNIYKAYVFDRMFLLNKGVYVINKSLQLLIYNTVESPYPSSKEQIYNYLEGCNFIFDIYINNNLLNYNWCYMYEHSPSLSEIYEETKYLSHEELKNIFDYTKKADNMYLTADTYQQYIDYLKFLNIKELLIKLNIKEKINRFNYHKLAEKYFTYDKIKQIFTLNGSKKFINKCINVIIVNIPKRLMKKIF